MYKVLVADDESIILNGIKSCIDHAFSDMEVVATASDGQRALEMIERFSPDLCLLDIHMPFIDGLTIAQRYLEKRPEGVVIFITGYDEFSYAQAAINTGATGYILKPVDEDELLSAVKKALDILEGRRKVDSLIHRNMDTLREAFFSDWLNGAISQEDASDNLAFHGVYPSKEATVLFVRFGNNAADTFISGDALKTDMDLIERNIRTLVGKAEPFFLMRPDDKTIVAVHSIADEDALSQFPLRLHEMLRIEGISVEILHRQIDSIDDVPAVYREMDEELSPARRLSPIVYLLKQYIDQNYINPEISLKLFANEHRTTSSYISRQFKQEMGRSFVDYLTFVRLNLSVQLLKKPHIKICAIAESVGYGSQHYYCEIFKQKMGVSPGEYRRRFFNDGMNEDKSS